MSTRRSYEMAEQRREPRFACSVPARVWVTQGLSVFGRAVDVSLHGMCILRSNLAPSDVISLGQEYRLDVTPALGAELHCVGVIRHLHDDAIGLETRGELPVKWLAASATRPSESGQT
ncbi:MAG: hypothetical protein DME09_06775 [Candidatus Rokuibacteriota bacterium]|nr:MAG: hypothetical protein DME09_06775 [Candidatus Rokubacteria bacterium]